jgi:hypothetical protein
VPNNCQQLPNRKTCHEPKRVFPSFSFVFLSAACRLATEFLIFMVQIITPDDTQPANSQQAPTPDPPPRRGKMHQDNVINVILCALPKAKKTECNCQIRSRNQECAIRHAYRQGNPTRLVPGERYSSDKSLITISDEEMADNVPSASQQA